MRPGEDPQSAGPARPDGVPGAAGMSLRAHRKPPRRRSIRTRIVSLLLVPLLSLVALWGFAANITLGSVISKEAASTTYNKVGLPGTFLSAQLQQERAQSTLYTGAGGRNKATLQAQRARTDAAQAAFRRSALTADLDDPDHLLKQRLAELVVRLDQLPELRSAVDARSIDRLATIDRYSVLTNSLLQLLSHMVLIKDFGIFQVSRSLLDSSWGLEFMFREAALVGTVQASDGKLSTRERAALTRWAGAGRQYFDAGLADLTGEWRRDLQAFAESPDYGAFRRSEEAIITSPGARLPVQAAQWQVLAPRVAGAWMQAITRTGAIINEHVKPIGQRIVARMFVAGGLGLVAVVASILLSVIVGRGLMRELRELRRAARQLAEERLPHLVGRLRRGEEVDVSAEARPLVTVRTTEVGQVADAFAQVQRTAVESAVGESLLRKGINRVFLNLAWRSQSLLHRQLRMLDEMERRTTDSEALQDLFRLDHLTTRMRRHAEGLVILSGAAPGREWSRPASMEDVLRSALAEVEEYKRVEVVTTTQTSLDGQAVADVVHLLAELIENATVFSPPNAEVLVRGGTVGNGYAIEIIDRGIGIEPAERARLNELLSRPPQFDLADTDRLGLFVVSLLAARRRMKVTLHESGFAGTTAIVVLPHAMVVDALDASPGPSAGLGQAMPPSRPDGVRSLGGAPRPEPAREPQSVPGAGPANGQWPQAPAAVPERPTLPRRRRMTHMAPQLRDVRAPRNGDADGGGPAAGENGRSGAATGAGLPEDRSPEETRRMWDSLEGGWRRGRAGDEGSWGGAPNGRTP